MKDPVAVQRHELERQEADAKLWYTTDNHFLPVMYLMLTAELVNTIYAGYVGFYLEDIPNYLPCSYVFLLISMIVFFLGSRLPNSIVVILLVTMAVSGYILGVIKMSAQDFSAGRGISELVSCMAFIYVTLSNLSPQAKLRLSDSRVGFLILTLFTVLLGFFLQVYDRLCYLHFVELLPLEGVSLTLLAIACLRITRFRELIDKKCKTILNISALFWCFVGLIGSRAINESSVRVYEDRLVNRTDFPPILALWWGHGTVLIISSLICISSMQIFNLLCIWRTEIERTEVEHGQGSEKESRISYYWWSYKRNPLFCMYILILACLAIYFCFNYYMHIYRDKSNRNIKEAYFRLYETSKNDKEKMYELNQNMFEQVEHLGKLMKWVNFSPLVADLFLLYFTYALMPFEYLVPQDSFLILFSLLILSGFTALYSLKAFHWELGCYILAHTAFECVALNTMPSRQRQVLSSQRNHILIISQICGQLIFMWSVAIQSTTMMVLVLLLLSMEYFGASIVVYWVRKGISHRKISRKHAPLLFCGYSLTWFLISLSLDVITYKMRDLDDLDSSWYGYLNLCHWAACSILFYVSSFLIFSLLNMWYYERSERFLTRSEQDLY